MLLDLFFVFFNKSQNNPTSKKSVVLKRNGTNGNMTTRHLTLSYIFFFLIYVKLFKPWSNIHHRQHSPEITFFLKRRKIYCPAKSVSLNFFPLVFDSKVNANQLRHFSSLCFVLGIWKWLKIPWVSENDPSTPVACSKSAKTFQTSKDGFAYQGHFSVPTSTAQEDLVIWIN